MRRPGHRIKADDGLEGAPAPRRVGRFPSPWESFRKRTSFQREEGLGRAGSIRAGPEHPRAVGRDRVARAGGRAGPPGGCASHPLRLRGLSQESRRNAFRPPSSVRQGEMASCRAVRGRGGNTKMQFLRMADGGGNRPGGGRGRRSGDQRRPQASRRRPRRGASTAEGPPAVLGTGVDVVYPRGHEGLFGRIVRERGALIAEYPLGAPPRQWRFPERNRIIAGIADRLVVVEAPLKSGAMSTARHALEAGREVWAVPGRISEEGCAGSNRLLFDGAQPLVSVAEFASVAFGRQLGLFPPGEEREQTSALTAKEQRILAVLKKYGERTVDNLAVECTMSPADIFSCLALLAAAGHVFPSDLGGGAFP